MRRARSPAATRARKRSARCAQRELGIDVQLARDVDGREQHVAELVEALVGGARRARSSSSSSAHRLQRRPRRRGSRSRSTPRGAAPCARTAAPAGSRAPRRTGPARGRARACLIRVPVAQHLARRRRRLDLAEHVRVAADQLLGHVVGDLRRGRRRRAPRAAATGSGPGTARRRARRAACASSRRCAASASS